MMEIILAGVVSLAITLAAGKLLIPALIRLKAGQSIKEVGPTWHKGKQGTPTMGGLMFIIGIGIAILILGWRGMLERNFTHLYVYVFALVFGVIGYIDDYQKVKHHHNTGLTAPQKFLLQLAAAIAFLCLMRYEGMLSPNLYIPFFNTHLVLPWVVYMIFAAFVIIGTVNAVNITDGIDGLSSSVTVPVAVFFAVLGGMWQGFGQLGVFAGALVGGQIEAVEKETYQVLDANGNWVTDPDHVTLIFTVTTTTPTAEVMTTKVGDQEVRIGKTDYILKSEYIEFSDGTITNVIWGD